MISSVAACRQSSGGAATWAEVGAPSATINPSRTHAKALSPKPRALHNIRIITQDPETETETPNPKSHVTGSEDWLCNYYYNYYNKEASGCRVLHFYLFRFKDHMIIIYSYEIYNYIYIDLHM